MEEQQNTNSQPTLSQNNSELPTVGVRQPWQSPTLKRLRVSLDTASTTGSGPDLGSATN